MTSPYANPEISRAGDPSMGQLGTQNANVNDNLYASSYPGAPGRPAPAGGTDLATQGLQQIQSGDQYGGIMSLLAAEQSSPQSVQNPAFLQQLQLVETSSGQSGSPTDASANGLAPGTSTDTSALGAQQPGATGDANQMVAAALQSAQTDPVSSILGLMQAETVDPTLINNQDFLSTMGQMLPAGPGAQGMDQSSMQSTPSDASQQPMDGSQQQVQPTDASQQQQQVQPTDASQQQQQVQPTDASQQQQQVQPTDASQQQQQVQPTDASQQQQQVRPTDASQQQQVQPTDGSQQQYQPQTQPQPQPQTQPAFAIPDGQPLTDTTNNPGSADPSIQQAVKQALMLLQSGDQRDGALLLMQVAKVDPQILQDQVFLRNLQIVEQAAKTGQSPDQSGATDQTNAQGIPLDANGNPIAMTDAQGNPISQTDAQGNPIPLTDAQGNPIPQAGAQQVMTDAQGNPIPQAGAQQVLTDAQGNPIAASTQQVMTDAQGNPIAPSTEQVMTDAQGNPIAPTGSQSMQMPQAAQ